MNKVNIAKDQLAVSPATAKSIKTLIAYAFSDMLKLLKDSQGLTTGDTTADKIKSYKQNTAMLTVSSSYFRLIVLLHYPAHKTLSDQQLRHFNPEFAKDAKQYHDYVCELGNNLCGVVCRVLGTDGFSTGMSTPALLNIASSASHLSRTTPYFEAHMASSTAGSSLLSTTFSLFFNSNANTELVINVPSVAVEDESLGELEFF